MKELEKFYKKITLQECKTEALEHETQREWFRKSELTYRQASDNGWIAECASHMSKKANSFTSKETSLSLNATPAVVLAKPAAAIIKSRKRKVLNISLNTVYNSIAEAARSVNRSSSSIKMAIKCGYNAGGCRWAYIETTT